MSEVRSMDFGPAVAGLHVGMRCFGRFRLLRPLGRGRLTTSWVARDTMAETELVLKFLPEALAADRALLTDLNVECRRLAGFRHHAVARVLNLWVERPLAAIATELVDGHSLAALMASRENGVLEESELAVWAGMICSTLEVAHERMHVVHHDLQVSQVFVERCGGARVTDFGTAASLRNAAARASGMAAFLASPPRVGPQQALGEVPSVADDIYAMGCLLYEALTGRPPFFGGDIVERVRSEVPPSVAQRRLELGVVGQPVSPGWEAVIAACLAKDTKGRPASARELADALGVPCPGADSVFTPSAETEAIAPADEAIPVPSPGGAAVAWWRPWAVPAAAFVVLVGGGLMLWSRGQKLPAPRNVPPAVAQPSALPAGGLGGVVVRSNPGGADIRLGTAVLQTAPVTVSDLKEGIYPIRAQMAGYEEWTGQVEVKRNAFAQVQVDLVPLTGSIKIESVPGGAEIRLTQAKVPGLLLGKTPLLLEKQRLGAVSFELRLAGRIAQTVQGEVRVGYPLVLKATLPPWEGPSEGQSWQIPGVGATLVWIPEGCFSDYRYDEGGDKIDYRNCLGWVQSGLWIGETEVTQYQWRSLMVKNPSKRQGAMHPVDNITCEEALEFCAKLTAQERAASRLPAGYEYSLPSETEWEYACRAGCRTRYSGGDEVEKLGWYRWNSDETHHEVRRKQPNPWGLYDMHGNVGELTRDGQSCGGSFLSNEEECTSSSGHPIGREPRLETVGFRIALRLME